MRFQRAWFQANFSARVILEKSGSRRSAAGLAAAALGRELP